MKTKTIYICDVCGEEYNVREAAEICEKISTPSPLFKIGDMVRILTGEGKSEIVKIIEYNYIKPSFCGYRFIHKIMYTGEFDNGDIRGLLEVDCEAA
jgi:hypothetical protein